MPDPTGARRWLLLICRVPQDPPGRRTYVWRQLKQLGAVYLQQAAAMAHRSDLQDALEALAERIRLQDGEVSLLETTSPAADWERDELRRETRMGKFTFAELEDIESDRDQIERWHARVVARDFFGAPAPDVAGMASRAASSC